MSDEQFTPEEPLPPDLGTESTVQLIALAKGGDQRARNQLIDRYRQSLRQWAHGRLPSRARSGSDTSDLVQDTFARAMRNLYRFEPRSEGSFLAYLRQILVNKIREEIRRSSRRAQEVELVDEAPDSALSPLEEAISNETFARYANALAHMPEVPRRAVILRLELGLSHGQIADALGRPSANAARMVVSRALEKLAQEMEEPSRPG